MADTIYMKIPINNGDFSRECLTEIIDEGYRRKGAFIKGKFKDLNIFAYEFEVHISGSLTKYYKGNNYDALTFEEQKSAFLQLQDELGFNIINHPISRYDFGHSIELTHNVASYMPLIVSIPRTERRVFKNSLYFDFGTDRQLIFYNKNLECKNPIKALKGKNVMRFEYRFLNNEGIKNLFNGKLTPYDLFNRHNYNKLINYLIEMNNKIVKLPNQVSEILQMDIRTKNDFIFALALKCAEYIGFEQLFELISQLQRDKKFNSSSYGSELKIMFKKAILENSKDYNASVKELDKAIEQSLQKFIV